MVNNLVILLQLINIVILIDFRLPKVFTPWRLLRLVLPRHVVEFHIKVLQKRKYHILLVLVLLLVKLVLLLLLNLDLVVPLRSFIQSHLVQRIVFSNLFGGVVLRICLINLLQLFKLVELIFLNDHYLLSSSFLIKSFLQQILLLLLFVTVFWIRS